MLDGSPTWLYGPATPSSSPRGWSMSSSAAVRFRSPAVKPNCWTATARCLRASRRGAAAAAVLALAACRDPAAPPAAAGQLELDRSSVTLLLGESHQFVA